MEDDIKTIARNVFKAFADKNRSSIEELIADDFCFTSPLDNKIDRKSYFERCWPNSEWIDGFEFKNIAVADNKVFVTYEGQSSKGKKFRNTEILTIRNRKLVEVEVYFGWNIPHEAEMGKYVESGGSGKDD